MLQIRKSEDRGHAEHGWLSSYHSFSFAGYQDPRHVAFGPLRVINEDIVIGGEGFGTHGHDNMEIVTYVLSGELEHKDSMGSGSVLRYGDVQHMSAGSGVTHSEFNHSPSNPVHLLQIWLFPDTANIRPSYSETHSPPETKRGQLRLIASPDGADGSLRIQQDARIFASILDAGQRLQHPLGEGRGAYVHVARGTLQVNGVQLQAGDALKLREESEVVLDNASDAEVLVFDLPM